MQIVSSYYGRHNPENNPGHQKNGRKGTSRDTAALSSFNLPLFNPTKPFQLRATTAAPVKSRFSHTLMAAVAGQSGSQGIPTRGRE